MRLETHYKSAKHKEIIESLQSLLLKAMKAENEDAIYSYIMALNKAHSQCVQVAWPRTYELTLD